MLALVRRILVARRPGRGGGFTLIEWIAVVVIISVMAVVAATALSSIGSTRAGIAAKQLQRDATCARQRAIETGTVTWVIFDTTAETWTILGEESSNPGRSNATVLSDLETGQDYTQSLGISSFAGVQIAGAVFDGDVEVGFDWLGQPRNGAETALAAQGSVMLTGGHVVNVEAGTGHIAHVAP